MVKSSLSEKKAKIPSPGFYMYNTHCLCAACACMLCVRFFEMVCLCVWVLCLQECLCTLCMTITDGGQKVSDLLGLEFQTVMSHHVVCARNQTHVL